MVIAAVALGHPTFVAAYVPSLGGSKGTKAHGSYKVVFDLLNDHLRLFDFEQIEREPSHGEE